MWDRPCVLTGYAIEDEPKAIRNVTDRTLRLARPGDVPELTRLIDESVRELSRGYYSPQQIDSALRHMFGVDTQLIADETYYVVERSGSIAAAGGWSWRRTLFGGDQMKAAEDPMLDPATEPARIRAFFVHPAHARQGLGRLLFDTCAQAARAAGFRELTLMATMPGEPLYAALGFRVVERLVVDVSGGIELPCARMTRALGKDDLVR
jgi:GNAT superfamily N-acetyltransferase